MIKSYKYKLIPNQEQQETLSKHFGCVRFVYNWGLNRKINTYKENILEFLDKFKKKEKNE